MTYAFIIVVSVAITLKLLFLSFSLYVTLKSKENEDIQDIKPEAQKKMLMKWKQFTRIFAPKSTYCHEITIKR